MRKVIWKGIWAHKIRLVLVSTAIVLGVGFVAGSFILTGTVNRSFDDLFASVYKNTDAVVRGQAPGGTFEQQRPPVPVDLEPTVAAVEGVQVAEGGVQGIAQLTNKEGKTIGGSTAPTFGRSWSDNTELNPFRITSGTSPRADNDVVIDAASAKDGKYAVGDSLKILTAQAPAEFTISGIAKFGEVDSPGGASYALFTEPRAHQLFSLEGKYSEISVIAKDGVSQEQLRDRIQAAVGPSADVATGAQVTKEQSDSVKSDLSFFNILLLVFAGISLFVGAFVINNVFAVLIAQRTKELALLRAIGARGRQVMAAVLIEALVVGVIASLLGLVFGVVLAWGALKLLEKVGVELISDTLVIGTTPVVAALLCGIIVTLVSSYFPARRAAKVPPLAAMRDVAVERTTPTLKRLVAGLVLLLAGAGFIALGLLGNVDKGYIPVGIGAALTFIAVNILAPTFSSPVTRLLGLPVAATRGISGVLAKENASRNPRRSSATASALMIGVALVAMFTVVFSSAKVSIDASIDKSFAGDFVVQGPQFMGGLPIELEQQVKSDPNVDAVSPQRNVAFVIDGRESFASAIDPTTFPEIYDLDVQSGSLGNLNNTTSVALWKQYADSHKYSVGQTIQGRFASSETQPYTVAAIFDDPGPLTEVVLSTAAYDANVPERFDAGIFVKLKDGVTVDQARPGLESIIAPYPNAELQDSEGIKESITEQVNLMLNILYGLLGIAVLIALLGIATTLALSVFERTHEIGLLRAVGMSRSQLRSSIRWESVIVAIFGTALGLIVGVGFALALVASLGDFGFDTVSLPYMRFVFIVVIAALAGVLAAIWPARRAARQNVLNAIATT